MTDWKLPWTGHCRCEQVEIQIQQPPLVTMACHCTGCQRMTASAYSLSVLVPAAGFAITRGEPVIGGLHGDDAHHYHCPHCKSWLFTRPRMLPDLVNVRASVLDQRAWYKPFVETWTSEAFPWARTGAPHSFPKLPDDNAWPGLVQAFLQSAAPQR
jgi:hypothetical protein